jgi:L-lactate utilization protein LutB
MDQPIENYNKLRLADLKAALESNNFDVYLAENKHEACNTVLEDIIPKLKAKSISWGGSQTFQVATGLYDRLKDNKELETLDTFDKKFQLKK